MPTFVAHITYRNKSTGLFAKLEHVTTQATPSDARKVAIASIKDIAIVGTIECRKVKLLREHGSR